MHIASNSFLDSLWGHVGLQTAFLASEVKFDLRFEISNLIYPGIRVHVASNVHFGGLWGCDSLQMTSEDTYDLIFELIDPNYLCWHVFLACKCYQIQFDRRPKMTHWPACFAAGKKRSYDGFCTSARRVAHQGVQKAWCRVASSSVSESGNPVPSGWENSPFPFSAFPSLG